MQSWRCSISRCAVTFGYLYPSDSTLLGIFAVVTSMIFSIRPPARVMHIGEITLRGHGTFH